MYGTICNTSCTYPVSGNDMNKLVYGFSHLESAEEVLARNESATHSKSYSTGVSSTHMEEGDSEDSEDSEFDESDEEQSDSSISSSDSQADSESDQEFEMEHSPTVPLESKYQSHSSMARKRSLPADFSQSHTKRIKCDDENILLSPKQSEIDVLDSKPERMAEVTKNVVCTLPPEVLALILCQLPPRDLLSCRRVNKMWNDTRKDSICDQHAHITRV